MTEEAQKARRRQNKNYKSANDAEEQKQSDIADKSFENRNCYEYRAKLVHRIE